MAAGMCLPDHEVEAQMRALQELGAMFSAAGGGCYNGGGGGGGYDCAAVVSGAAQSELTCNNGGGVCGGAVGMGVGAGRKREREAGGGRRHGGEVAMEGGYEEEVRSSPASGGRVKCGSSSVGVGAGIANGDGLEVSREAGCHHQRTRWGGR
jgi:hypothetical protein